MTQRLLSAPVIALGLYPNLRQLQSKTQANPSSQPQPDPARPTTPSASQSPPAASTTPSLPSTQAEAAPSIRPPTIDMATAHAQAAPSFPQPSSANTPLLPTATSTSNSSQPSNPQPAHSSRPRPGPVSSATLAAPEAISAGPPLSEDQSRSLSNNTVATRKNNHSLEPPESLYKAQQELRDLRASPIKFVFRPTIHNHNTNVNHPPADSDQPSPQSSSRRLSSQQPAFQQPSARHGPPVQEPRMFPAYPFTGGQPQNIRHVAKRGKSWIKRVYGYPWVWVFTGLMLCVLVVLGWFILGSQDIQITSPQKMNFVAPNEKFAIDRPLQTRLQESLAHRRVKEEHKCALREISDRLAINQLDTTNSYQELLTKLHEIFALGQDSTIPLTLPFTFPSWPWTITRFRQKRTALALVPVFEPLIHQVLAHGDLYLRNISAWKDTFEHLFNFLQEQKPPGSCVHAYGECMHEHARRQLSMVHQALNSSVYTLAPLGQRAELAYNGTVKIRSEMEGLRESCWRDDGRGCEELSEMLLGGKVFEVLGQWAIE
ncbi:MAG: hypothetical protein Q9184_007569 [Pyrenodesmia sp. 2 TL-2023]